MQERRYRPGDVLDDYCPRERRITDHAIVAMIDDDIRRTRCGSCDAEHEYKEGKVPAPRRKTQPPALFNQVLETMNGSAPHAPVVAASAVAAVSAAGASAAAAVAVALPVADHADPVMMASTKDPDPPPAPDATESSDESQPAEDDSTVEEPEREGGFRRSLIRATFPRPEGTPPPPRAVPEFTIQSLHNRRNAGGQRHAGGANKFRGGRRRPGGGGSQDNLGPMRFRDHGQQSGQGQGQGQGQGGGRRRRGGKKNR